MTDFDNPWKEVLDGLFKECLQLFFPDLHDALDWSRECESLEQELRQITREAEVGLKIADKLVKAWRLDGNEAWLLLHLEVQNQAVQEFPERMFTSYYRIRDNYGVYPVSLAILGDSQHSWRPNQFLNGEFGCRLSFEFPIIKLSDFKNRTEELEASKNPFAKVVLAHLATLSTATTPAVRYVEKLRLIKSVYGTEWSRLNLVCLRFIDWVMWLPPELEQRCTLEINEIERGAPMPYVTTFERHARREGLEEGLEIARTGLRAAIQTIWTNRFATVPDTLVSRLCSVTDLELLNKLVKSSLTAELPDIEAHLP